MPVSYTHLDVYKRQVFKTIGYFDEMHFAYLEDIDDLPKRVSQIASTCL